MRNCPQCGGVVNAAVGVKQCPETAHATLRRQQYRFCTDCGLELIAAR